MPKLSIIIPCYNEVGNIPALINRLELIKNDYTARQDYMRDSRIITGHSRISIV